jgi:hypothetical protein
MYDRATGDLCLFLVPLIMSAYVRLHRFRWVGNPIAPSGSAPMRTHHQHRWCIDKSEAQAVVMEGLLVCPPRIRKEVAVIRVARSGLKQVGVDWTQPATWVGHSYFHPVGSAYEIIDVTPYEWN